jgi:hypothetical protein
MVPTQAYQSSKRHRTASTEYPELEVVVSRERSSGARPSLSNPCARSGDSRTTCVSKRREVSCGAEPPAPELPPGDVPGATPPLAPPPDAGAMKRKRCGSKPCEHSACRCGSYCGVTFSTTRDKASNAPSTTAAEIRQHRHEGRTFLVLVSQQVDELRGGVYHQCPRVRRNLAAAIGRDLQCHTLHMRGEEVQVAEHSAKRPGLQ